MKHLFLFRTRRSGQAAACIPTWPKTRAKGLVHIALIAGMILAVSRLVVFGASITVTNVADSGAGTLRQAIADAVSGDTIDFAVTGRIALSGVLDINNSLTVAGPGATNLAISGEGNSRLFNITAGPTTLSGLTLINASSINEVEPDGGAIRNTAQLTLSACEFTNNFAFGSGGAVMNAGSGAELTVTACTFAQNSAYDYFNYIGDGGAIANDGILRVTNSTFSGNTAVMNGGAVANSSNAVLASSTITGNSATYGSGGGIFNDGGALVLQNSIVAGNSGFPALDISGLIDSGDYNLIQGTNGLVVPGTHNLLGIAPLLGGLADNGGPTHTHGLASISPALDAGDGAACPATDQRGVARPAGAACDIGAFEGALPENHPPVLANPIATLTAVFGDNLSYMLPAGTFSDPDAGQTLAYSMADSFIAYFIPETRTINAFSLPVGTNSFIVTATDNGAPPLSVSVNIELVVGKRPLTARADDQCRPYGDPNPLLSITYFGANPCCLAAPPVATTTATSTSPPGAYPIVLSAGSDDNYEFVGSTNGTLTVMDYSVDYRVVRSFGFTNQMGFTPTAKVIEGSDGVLYGTTYDVIYRINRDGTDYRILRWLRSEAPLREFSDGALYGTTKYGGSNGFGTVFKLNKDGTGFTTLHEMTDEIDDGSYPQTQLLEGSDGLIYGTARRVFSMNTNGTGYTIVHRFQVADGYDPRAPLIEGTDGALYGGTWAGGSLDGGTLYKVNKDGTGFEVLHAFPFDNLYSVGAYPQGVIEGSDGLLYGVTQYGGAASSGEVFKLNKDGTGYSIMHTFDAFVDGSYPSDPLVEGGDGALYGVTQFGPSFGNGILFRVDRTNNAYSVVFEFDDSSARAPVGLTQGSDGKFYIACSDSYGAVLRVNQDGTEATGLWYFSSSGGDASHPSTALFEATNGRLYGAGFSLNKDGTGPAVLPIPANITLLQASDGLLYGMVSIEFGGPSYLSRANLDGSGATNFFEFPIEAGSRLASLNEGSDGALYGAASTEGALGGGTLFKVNKDGSGFAVLHEFERNFFDSSPVSFPAYVFEAGDGKLYGICTSGGDVDFTSVDGAVFRMERDGSGYTNLHIFSDPVTGVTRPFGRLIEASDGRLYGTTLGGYDPSIQAGGGAVFGLNKDGAGYSVLRILGVNSQDARNPYGVTEGNDGYLYGFGTGYDPGPFYPIISGSIYRLKKDGTEYCVLHRFSAAPGDQSFPAGWPIQGSDGAFYGAAGRGGAYEFGAIFRFAIQPVMLNQSPTLDIAIPDQFGSYGSAASFTFSANTFSDPDVGQTLSYVASGLPPGVVFDSPSRTFNGTLTNVGLYAVNVTATDDGTLPLSTNAVFNFLIAPVLLVGSSRVDLQACKLEYSIVSPK